MTPSIFIVNDSGHDFSAAEEFGELTIMSSGLIDKYNVTRMWRVFRPFIQASSPADYIVQGGPSGMYGVACAMFAAKHNCLNILTWRVERGGKDHYVHRRLDFGEGEKR